METTIPCRNCDHPLKSGSCLGCNVFRLYEALQRGKLDWAKDEHNGIVEGKLEQPTISPDDLRPVGKWIALEPEIGLYGCSRCEHKILRAECNYCPNCGAKMEVSEDG